MPTIEYSQVRRGQILMEKDGQLYHVVDRDLKTPGNLRSILTLRLKNLKSGLVNEVRVSPTNKVELAYLDRRDVQYLYQDGGDYVFMDVETFDQTTLSKAMVGDLMFYLKEGDKAQIIVYDDKPVSLEPPATVELKVVETEPSVKGGSATVQYKPATLETGLKITVPPFVNVGDVLVVDTTEGKYLSRAK